jgi:hypothetical protein
LGEYVSVYEQQIEALNNQIGDAKYEFDLLTEEKRLREEQEEAQAAQKAKESEYGDMKIALDEAKEAKDHWVAEVKSA